MKTRFAPSPTGFIHLGNARAALFNVLLSLSQHGTFLLRVEDTDKARSTEEFVQELQTDLNWLGFSWNEGPYFQSERQAIYDQYYEKLQSAGHAYPCFCSEEELMVVRKLQQNAGKPPRYSNKCRYLTPEDISEKLSAGEKPTLRFKMPANKSIEFEDFVKGKQKFLSDDIGDFIIRRADGSASFMFCNAIDDALMQVTHAMRGDDHLANTPRQLAILEVLGLPASSYGHLPMILGDDGTPLSKRNGSRSIRALREMGFLPNAVVNYMARLGHYYENNQLLSLQALADLFETKNLSISPARYDENQLLFWQKQAFLSLSEAEFFNWASEAQSIVPNDRKTLFFELAKETAFPFPSQIFSEAIMYFKEYETLGEDAQTVIEQAGAIFFSTALKAIELYQTDFNLIKKYVAEHLNIQGKSLFMPFRAALTGRLHGSDLGKVLLLIGAHTAKERLHRIIQSLA